MFVRKKPNASGTTSIQIIKKINGKNKVVESIGCSKDEKELNRLTLLAEIRIKELTPQLSFDFKSNKDQEFLDNVNKLTPKVYGVGIDKTIGKIFDDIGFNQIKYDLFKDIVLARLAFPVSKLKTTDYLMYQNHKEVEVTKIYRFLDKFHKDFKPLVEQIAFNYTKSLIKEIAVVFYDVTTLYFESEDEDDLRKIGYSKDGKFQHPQILLGLLVAEHGYPVGYDIFEGNTFEGKTFLPVLKAIETKYDLPKPIVIADSGLLSKSNIELLKTQGYKFIIGARIKNETKEIKKIILDKSANIENGKSFSITKDEDLKLIINYSTKRAKKDAHNRDRGINKLRKQIKSGRLTKNSINNRGYNRFLLMESKIKVQLDEEKIQQDCKWDGLKGFITNSQLPIDTVISNYKHLWQVEKAFRISKTDLRIRPIFHRKKDRIESHICIAFAAYTIFKELERILLSKKIALSATKAIEILKYIYEIEFYLPESLIPVRIYSTLSEQQKKLLEILA